MNEDGSISFNSLSWSQFGSVLYTDSPVGTGFSYDSRGGPVHMNDSQAAIDMMTLLDAYFEYFPELQNAPVWLTGESYGGNYVPNLLSLVSAAVRGSSKQTFSYEIMKAHRSALNHLHHVLLFCGYCSFGRLGPACTIAWKALWYVRAGRSASGNQSGIEIRTKPPNETHAAVHMLASCAAGQHIQPR